MCPFESIHVLDLVKQVYIFPGDARRGLKSKLFPVNIDVGSRYLLQDYFHIRLRRVHTRQVNAH